MPRNLRFKPSLREQLRRSARSSLFQANPQRRQELLADPNVHESVKEGIRRQIAFEQAMSQPAKKRSANLPRLDAPTETLERDIQSAIMEALRLHPRVVKVIRCNSGGSMYRGKDGREHLVMFTSEPVVDLHIMLRGPAGWGWLEVKRPSWKRPTDAREERQAAFLQAVRAAGGIGAFVRSVDEAMEAIGTIK